MPPSDTQTTLGILAAMPEEAEAILADLVGSGGGLVDRIEHGRRTFHFGELAGSRVIVVVARCGKVAAATTATELVVRFGVTELVMTGVAGGLGPGVRVGDVVIADSLVQHDLDASPMWPPRVVPLLDVGEFPTDGDLSAALAAAARRFLADEAGRAAAAPEHGPPRLHVGRVASGDRFIRLADEARAIREATAAVAVEMEGAAVAQVAFEYGVRLAVVRAISDRADEEAAASFSESLGGFAARYAHGILGRWLSSA